MQAFSSGSVSRRGAAVRQDHRKMRAEDLFAAFFKDVTADELSEAERAEVTEALRAMTADTGEAG